jgi:hypothetical protein
VFSERPGHVMVLAVDVRGKNHTAEGDPLGTRRYGREPAARQKDPVQLLKRQGERGQDTGGFLGDFCASWLRFSRKIPSKSLIA